MSAAANEERPPAEATLAATKSQCWFCGNLHHPRRKCPARQVTCHKCSKTGHFAKMCHSSKSSTQSTAIVNAVHTMSINNSPTLSSIKGKKLKALIDNGSTDRSFINQKSRQKA